MADFDLSGSVRAGQGLLAPVAELMQRLRQNEEDAAGSDALAQMAVKNGLMPHEEYEQYQKSPLEKKKGIVGTLTIRWAQKQQEQAQQQREQQMQLHREQMAQSRELAELPYQFQPTEADMGRARAAGGELLPTGRGQYHFAPYPDSTASHGAIQVDPFTDPSTNKPVPGMGIVRKTGQIGYFGALLNQGGVPIETDQATGMKFYRDAKGNPKPLDPRNVARSQMLGEMAGQLPAAPAATPAAVPAKVRVKAPDGRVGSIPAAQLQQALAKGYQQVQ